MIKSTIKKIANLKLAIFLLLLIAFNSSLGSIIEQDKEKTFYINTYKSLFFNFSTGQLILNLGLDHIFTTSWFNFLLVLFGLCLTTCTFLQQLPALKFARRYYFHKDPKNLKKHSFNFSFISQRTNVLMFFLKTKQYSIFQKKRSIYAYKGLIGRVGPIIVHASIIWILLGSILSSLSGFTAQEFIPKTEIFHLQNIVKTGFLSKIPQTSFRVNDFWSTYTQSENIKQFYSDISILNGFGKEIQKQTISVNKPFRFKNLTFYQTDWEISGLRLNYITKTYKKIQLPLSQILQSKKKVWVSWIPLGDFTEKSLIFILLNNRGQVQVYNNKGIFLKNINISDSIKVNENLYINLVDFINLTGIQIKADPGLWPIYSGFFSLILSSFISYMSFSELWVIKKKTQSFCGGQTNRAKVNFHIETTKLKIKTVKKTSFDF